MTDGNRETATDKPEALADLSATRIGESLRLKIGANDDDHV
jgi:hypothetical protein